MEVIFAGGVIYPRLGVLVGPLTVEAFSKIHADVAVMSAGGITLEGITNSHALLIEIQRAMIRTAAQKMIFCLDHLKIRAAIRFAAVRTGVIDTIVTDSRAPQELVAGLRERGIEVVVAPRKPEPASTPPAVAPPPPVRRRLRRVRRASPRPSGSAAARAKPPPAAESSDSRMGWD